MTKLAHSCIVSGLLWLIPAFPLLGAGINLFVGKRLGSAAGWVGSLTVIGSFVWGALATVVPGLPAWDLHTALGFAPLLVAATLAVSAPAERRPL